MKGHIDILHRNQLYCLLSALLPRSLIWLWGPCITCFFHQNPKTFPLCTPFIWKTLQCNFQKKYFFMVVKNKTKKFCVKTNYLEIFLFHWIDFTIMVPFPPGLQHTTVLGFLFCLWTVCYKRCLPRLVFTSWQRWGYHYIFFQHTCCEN